jgi:hypothetical protein
MLSPFTRRRLRLAAAFWLVVLGGSAARGAVIQYEYGGVITAADASTGVAPGTRFSGTFAYDPEFKPGAIMIEGSTTYDFSFSDKGSSVPDTSRLTLQVGGNSPITGNGLAVGVTDSTGFPGANTGQVPPATLMGVAFMNPELLVGLSFRNSSRSLDPTLALPTSWSLDDFPEANLAVINRASGRGEHLYDGKIDTLTQVPEPTSLAAFGMTLLGLAWHHRRRSTPRG